MFRASVRWDDVSSPFVDASGPVRSRWSVNLAWPSFRSSLLFRLRVTSAGCDAGRCGLFVLCLGGSPGLTLAWPPFRPGLTFRLRVIFAGYGVGWSGCPCFELDVAPENRVLHWMWPRSRPFSSRLRSSLLAFFFEGFPVDVQPAYLGLLLCLLLHPLSVFKFWAA